MNHETHENHEKDIHQIKNRGELTPLFLFVYLLG